MSRLRPSRLSQAIALLCIAAPLGGLPAGAAARNVDLGNLGDRGFRIAGIDVFDRSGTSVSGAVQASASPGSAMSMVTGWPT
jgi:hypothetical protein